MHYFGSIFYDIVTCMIYEFYVNYLIAGNHKRPGGKIIETTYNKTEQNYQYIAM